MKKSKIIVVFLLLASMVIAGCTIGSGEDVGEADENIAKVEDDNNKITDTNNSGLTGVLDGQEVPSLEGKTIGVAVVSTTHNFNRTVYEAQIKRIEDLGGKVIAVDGEANDQSHIANIENLIIQSPDAIIKILGDTSIYEPILKKIQEANIPLFTVDHGSEYSECNGTSDNYAIGTGLARTIFENMGGQGKVAVFNGFYGVRTSAIRYDMLEYVAQDYPGVSFIEPLLQDVSPGTVDDAYKKVQDLMLLYPENSELKAITAAWDLPGIGAAQVLDAEGRKDVKIYGIDGDPTALEMVMDPNSCYEAIMVQNPKLMGEAIVDQAARYLAGGEIPNTVYIEPVLVTKDNYETSLPTVFGEDWKKDLMK